MTPTTEEIKVRAIPVSSITANDLSCDPEQLESLKESIRESSLLHPITVQRLPYDGESDKYELIAGKKRLRAIIDLDHTQIQALIFPPGMSPDQIQEIALQENLRRFNLPWYEVAEQEAQLHELRINQHGQRANGVSRGNAPEAWSLRDTANELGKAVGAISEDLKLAEALKHNPSLRKVKDRKTALKLVKEFGKREQAILDAQLPVNFELDQVLCGDSLELLKNFPPNSFDACITDPPWLEYKDASLTRDDSTVGVFKEVYRVLKPNSFLYVIVGLKDFVSYQDELTKMGYSVQKWPLIWKKSGTMTHGLRSWEYQRDFELIVLAAKGSPVLSISTDLSAFFEFPVVPSVKLTHPNEKPIELMKKIISHCSFDGSKILDPFAGSGVTLEACQAMGRRYIGIERDHKFFEQIERRLGK